MNKRERGDGEGGCGVGMKRDEGRARREGERKGRRDSREREGGGKQGEREGTVVSLSLTL